MEQKIKNLLVIPSVYGNEEIIHSDHSLLDRHGHLKIQLGKVPTVTQNLMCNKAEKAFSKLQEIPCNVWLEYFIRSGEKLEQQVNSMSAGLMDTLYDISLSTGLPLYRLRKAFLSLANKMMDMPMILRHQNLSEGMGIYDCEGFIHRSWRYVPRAHTVAIQVPGNYPSINITWLTALAMKRPVLLGTSLKDPLTPILLAKLLYAQGIPDGAISIVCDDFDLFYKRGGQRLTYSHQKTDKTEELIALRDKKYHSGQSKFVLLDCEKVDYEKVAAMVMQGSGRLCTNPSSLLVTENEFNVAQSLARALGKYKIHDLSDIQAIVPAFDYHEERRSLAGIIENAVLQGAIDISEQVTGEPLVLEKGDHYFLRPTVLLMDVDHPMYGKELPFPFITVSRCDKDQIPRYCKFSLIVSVVGEDVGLYDSLIKEPTIDKVFSTEHYDRGYNPYDAHEEHLFDFLFKKKTIC